MRSEQEEVKLSIRAALFTHFHLIRRQIKQGSKLFCLVVPNLDLIKLRSFEGSFMQPCNVWPKSLASVLRLIMERTPSSVMRVPRTRLKISIDL